MKLSRLGRKFLVGQFSCHFKISMFPIEYHYSETLLNPIPIVASKIMYDTNSKKECSVVGDFGTEPRMMVEKTCLSNWCYFLKAYVVTFFRMILHF